MKPTALRSRPPIPNSPFIRPRLRVRIIRPFSAISSRTSREWSENSRRVHTIAAPRLHERLAAKFRYARGPVTKPRVQTGRETRGGDRRSLHHYGRISMMMVMIRLSAVTERIGRERRRVWVERRRRRR